MHQHAKQTKDL